MLTFPNINEVRRAYHGAVIVWHNHQIGGAVADRKYWTAEQNGAVLDYHYRRHLTQTYIEAGERVILLTLRRDKTVAVRELSALSNSAQTVRLQKVNELLGVIAGCGRHFFAYAERVAFFYLRKQGRVWFVDAFSQKAIYMHHTGTAWRGFSEGGTLRDVVIGLRDFIQRGEPLTHACGPWPDWYSDGDPWGYGAAMGTVRAAAVRLGITPTAASDKEHEDGALT